MGVNLRNFATGKTKKTNDPDNGNQERDLKHKKSSPYSGGSLNFVLSPELSKEDSIFTRRKKCEKKNMWR